MAWGITVDVQKHIHGFAVVVQDYEDINVITDVYTNKQDLLLNLTNTELHNLINEYVAVKDNNTLGTYEVQTMCLIVGNNTVYSGETIDLLNAAEAQELERLINKL